MSKTIHVAVAVILNDKNEVCISLRHQDAHQGGLWEFPGGKIEAGESVGAALIREIKEEINLDILHTQALIKISHDYADKSVCLHVHKVLSFDGELSGNEGQQVKWLALHNLKSHDFPEANHAIINALLLPDRYLITGKYLDLSDFEEKLSAALEKGIRLVQLRLKQENVQDMHDAREIVKSAETLCNKHNAQLMLNIPQSLLEDIDLTNSAIAGFHLDSRSLKQQPSDSSLVSNDRFLLSASCHNEEELMLAKKLNADFVVLSPVQKTASHPEMDAIGWDKFEQLIERLSIPAYALGGVGEGDIDYSKQRGGQGVAAISAFWSKSS